MFVSFSLSLLSLGCQANQVAPSQDFFVEDDGLSLLQLKSSSYKADDGLSHRLAMAANTSRTRRFVEPAGDRERQLCPHELEEIAQETKTFGCRGVLQAPATRTCNIWGDPHVSRTFPLTKDLHILKNQGQTTKTWDVMWKPGLFRLAAASDGTWEVQMMNCGTWAAAAAARFGKHVVEFVSTANNQMAVFLNGKQLEDGVEWPVEVGNMFIDNSHRKATTHWTGNDVASSAGQAKRGGCVDDPGGQVYVDVSRVGQWWQTFSIMIEAAEGSFTTLDSDPQSICNVDVSEPGFHRFANWQDPLPPEDSLFIGSGTLACDQCRRMGWVGGNTGAGAGVQGATDGSQNNAANGAQNLRNAQQACAADVPKKYDNFDVDSMCKTHSIPVESAQAACVHLQDDPHFYDDCQLDFCSTDGNQEAVEEAEHEEHAENPQPVCAVSDDTCDPASLCCNALKDQAILNFGNVVQNNLCGDGNGARELRFGSVLTQDGQTMDLVVKPVDHDCGRATNQKNGMKSELLATLAVQAGRKATFDFQFVASGTDSPATPKSVVLSFLDLDQGKKGKQQESVEVCGAANAIVSDTTELQQSSNGNCLKFSSSTWGNAHDNPNSPDTMSDVQRARAVAYQIAGSSFRATLGVAGSGRNPRKFLFTGHPSIACK